MSISTSIFFENELPLNNIFVFFSKKKHSGFGYFNTKQFLLLNSIPSMLSKNISKFSDTSETLDSRDADFRKRLTIFITRHTKTWSISCFWQNEMKLIGFIVSQKSSHFSSSSVSFIGSMVRTKSTIDYLAPAWEPIRFLSWSLLIWLSFCFSTDASLIHSLYEQLKSSSCSRQSFNRVHYEK